MERRLAAILCADVAGYSRMMGIDEDGTHAAFKAHRGAIHPIILNHAGRIVKHTGDGFLLEFATAASAIQFGIEMQSLMAERNADLPSDRNMRFRLGIHQGEFTVDDGEAFGDGINVAVNLETIAVPGGVAVSAKAYEEAGPQLPIKLTSAGSFQFKNLQEPVQAWTWEPGSEAAIRTGTGVTGLPPQYRSAIVGVLPFVNLSDGGEAYLADGLADDLIHALSLQSFFRVLSRTSTFRFRDRGLNPRLIAREIDATYLIQGTVRRARHRLRVTAELIAPETGAQLWTGRYDGDVGDLFAMQDEITTSLCAALMPEIYRVEASIPVRAPATDPTAWDRFLRGLSHYYRPTKADYEISISLFRQAIALDPTLGLAHAYLATILMQGINFGWIKGSRELWDEAKNLALDSVRLDARSSFAYAILAFVQAMQGDHEDGMKAARKATELNAYDMGARGVLGLCHMVNGEHQQAIDQFSIAAQRGNSDPRYQWPALNAYSHYLLGRYEAALSWAREELLLYPDHLQALTIRAATLAQLGATDQAGDAVAVLRAQYPWLTLDRHIKNIRWKRRDDIDHYRDGLIRAGLT
ncbi:adenylate/guanylate cyclase domain-containing protein [Bradyrhizobium sp. HKCCYLRH3061]|uniref:adenylate/guanylate cyclase domain-containing protein n=1 Tax=Bradyrhizobium sp. HKCCYLRH3061 TaxID=3420734 RepID=UPI003EC0E0B6